MLLISVLVLLYFRKAKAKLECFPYRCKPCRFFLLSLPFLSHWSWTIRSPEFPFNPNDSMIFSVLYCMGFVRSIRNSIWFCSLILCSSYLQCNPLLLRMEGRNGHHRLREEFFFQSLHATERKWCPTSSFTYLLDIHQTYQLNINKFNHNIAQVLETS